MDSTARSRPRSNGYLRAKVRHIVLTKAADALTLGALGRRHAAQEIQVRELEVRCAGWPREHDGLRIAHVTDFHLGHHMPTARAIEAVERVGALKPDLLACTGDVVDLELDGAEPLLAAMGAVHAPMGRYLVLGNHDHLDDGAMLASMAVMRGVEHLDGTVARCGSERAPLLVGGIDWSRSARGLAQKVHALPQVPHLLLAHNPRAFFAAAARGVPLTLSGHTHGGQVALKGRPRANLSLTNRLSAGFYHRQGRALFVSVGAGAWFPVRVHCAPEVVLLTVRCG
ncbi:MAG: metallophosphoesterase [Phycisphaerales bacterium]